MLLFVDWRFEEFSCGQFLYIPVVSRRWFSRMAEYNNTVGFCFAQALQSRWPRSESVEDTISCARQSSRSVWM